MKTLAGALAAALTALALAGCSYTYPHACDGHGGIRDEIKAIYYCRDWTFIGSGWLWLHPRDPRARS